MIILNAFRIYTYEAELVTILTHFKQVPALLFLKDENDVTNDSYCLVRKLEQQIHERRRNLQKQDH
jgi:hypothetical protein